uniref:[phosphatase 2A protein]-leucine-carboxy methyltransferase n=1 Tax=Macrostomum lignano TaxID=282301 RepID=A0A1I8FPB9_9PLAT
LSVAQLKIPDRTGHSSSAGAMSEKQVQGTNDSSIASAVERGYFDDPFVSLMVRKRARRAPLINRGYYIRMKAMDQALQNFISATSAEGQTRYIISLGAGFDTAYFRLKSKGLLDGIYYIEGWQRVEALDMNAFYGRFDLAERCPIFDEFRGMVGQVRATTSCWPRTPPASATDITGPGCSSGATATAARRKKPRPSPRAGGCSRACPSNRLATWPGCWSGRCAGGCADQFRLHWAGLSP